MQTRKSPYLRIIPCSKDVYVCYHTLFNRPLMINSDVVDFLSGIPTDHAVDASHCDPDVLSELLHGNVLVAEAFDEKISLGKKNRQFLRKLSKGKSFRSINLRVSESCNFGCKHCIAGAREDGKLMSPDVAVSATRTLIEFILERRPGFSGIEIDYGNAEPLLNFDTIRAVQNCLREDFKGRVRKVSLGTNLSLLTEEIANYLTEEKITVNVSLDGPDAGANDAIRVFKDGTGTFNTISENMRFLRDAGMTVDGVSMTVNDLNFPFLHGSLSDWCHENGFTCLAIDFDLINPLLIPIEERAEFIVKTWRSCADKGIECFGTWATPFLALSNKSILSSHYGFCKGTHGEAVSVDANGNIHACAYTSSPLGHYSRIRELFKAKGKLYDLVGSRLVGTLKSCAGCSIEGACAGQCLATVENSTPDALENHCQFYRLLTDKLLMAQCEQELF